MTILADALVGISASAQWPADPSTNLPIAIDPHANELPKAASDGQGGVIIAWEFAGQSTLGKDIYVRRINSLGGLEWPAAGVPATSAAEYQVGASIVSDGVGGAIVAWQDFRSNVDWDIYAQRLDASGNVMWSANGIPLCTAANDQLEVELVAHAQGGAVAVWRDMRADGLTGDVFAQRISQSGVSLWTTNGVSVCANVADQERLDHVSISGATIVVWDDGRNQGGTSRDIFAQRITPNGATSWALDGISVCSAPRWQLSAEIVVAGDGGVIVAWEDDRTASNGRDVYAQHVDSLGLGVWGANGVPVCTTSDTQVRPQLIGDGTGGTIICWPDGRNGSSIYASRVGSNGQPLWVSNGVVVCEAAGTSDWPQIVGDGSGGAIIAWEDTRNNPSFHDVYAQRLDFGGNSVWISNGVAVSTATDSQHRLTPVPDSDGGLIVAWEDWRDGGYLAQRDEVYAQHVNADGSLGGPTGVPPVPPAHGLRILTATPNPFNSNTTVAFHSEISSDIEVHLFSVSGRLLFRDRTRASGGENRYLFRGLDDGGSRLSSGVYFLRLRSGGATTVSKLVIAR